MEHTSRYGRFTSSEIWKLMTNDRKGTGIGTAGLTYIRERGYERKLNRSLSQESGAKATEWGTRVESYAFGLLGTDYRMQSQQTYVNQAMPYHSGSPDCIRFGAVMSVVDIKCPFTLKAFAELSEIETGEQLKSEKPEYYWQLVSNGILTNCQRAELIAFCPTEAMLTEIVAQNSDWKWLEYASMKELPYLVEGCKYEPIHVLGFDIPQADTDALTARIQLAESMLNPTAFIASQIEGGMIIESL